MKEETYKEQYDRAKKEAAELRAIFNNRRALRKSERQGGEAEKDRLIRAGIQRKLKV